MIWLHLVTAVLAVSLGAINLAADKGTTRHRIIGWCWISLMTVTALSSFRIQEINPGSFSWIHGLSLLTLASMACALIAIRRGNVRLHAIFMINTFAGAFIAGIFALLPGRFISEMIGYS
tara:strand:+ start:6247 stop:6606 length:360 start_codon:yes stop_codon:yes gene_type:complete